jgi:hypothetical protein
MIQALRDRGEITNWSMLLLVRSAVKAGFGENASIPSEGCGMKRAPRCASKGFGGDVEVDDSLGGGFK